jgi:hypothetical protein
MKVDLGRDGKLIAAQHSAESSQRREDELRRQPCCRHPGNLRQQATTNISAGPERASRNWVVAMARQGGLAAGTNAADAQPTSAGNACHAQADEDRELVVNVTVDGLECQQQENLQRHQGEAGRSHAAAAAERARFSRAGTNARRTATNSKK